MYLIVSIWDTTTNFSDTNCRKWLDITPVGEECLSSFILSQSEKELKLSQAGIRR